MHSDTPTPVIARLILKNGAEVWRPAVAHQRARPHVLVSLPGGGEAWLRTEDVVQEIRGPIRMRP